MKVIHLTEQQRALVDGERIAGRKTIKPLGYIYPGSVAAQICKKLKISESKLTWVESTELEFPVESDE